MKTKTIYLIRHGETEYNRKGIVQGSGIDAELNEMGKAQANAFFEAYQYIPFDKIYTSKLQRTVQSVEKFIELGIPYEQLSGLNEISWGEKEGKIPNYQDDGYYLNLINEWQTGNTHLPVIGGESPEEVAERQQAAIQYILSNSDEEIILIAMHGRAIRILLTHLLQLPLSEMDSFEHSNLCLYKLKYDYETNNFQVELANDTTHLLMLSV